MALTEIQKDWLTKSVLYAQLTSMANKMNGQFVQISDRLEWLNLVSSGDLGDIAVPAETQTLLANFRTALNGLKSEYDTNVASIIDQMRTL